MSGNNTSNNNDKDVIVITPNMSKNIPYFEGMRSFYRINPNDDLVIKRKLSEFSNDEFDALKSIMESGSTSKYALASFFANYLGINKNLYNPTLPSSEVASSKRKRPVSHSLPVKLVPVKRSNNYNNYYNKYNNKYTNFNMPTRKELLKAALMEALEEQRNNEAVVVENVLGNTRHNMVSLALKAKNVRSKYPKSGKRMSKTSRTSRKHATEKGNRQRARNFARTLKKLVGNRN